MSPLDHGDQAAREQLSELHRRTGPVRAGRVDGGQRLGPAPRP